MRHSDVKASSFPPQAIAVQRWDAIDVARGLAILAMIVYHFSWDLSFLKLIETNILEIPAWRWFARGIAGSFLMLSGLGLVLAHAKSFDGRSFLKRLIKVGGAALAVTFATYFAFPDSYIFFGILHCIAVSSVLALPFLRMHPAVTLTIAALCLMAPHVLTAPVLDAPWLDWLGLGSADPVTNDYVPIFPWLAPVLIGVAAGRALLARQETMRLAGWRSRNRLSGLLIWAGRKSLPIYLTHQVILLGILYGVLQIVGPNRMAEAQPFMLQCQATCLQNAQPQTCRALCSCTVETLRQSDLWQKVLNDTTTAEDQARISRAAQQCLRQSPPS
ncbi:heparan-alpha-glucosaminide N-acetyltransferase [Microvirga sp. CF3062]|uniref:heparan-alpha-glucosaminide N-acetyltransferase n=1 Tax=Microvirga sp. CF3062 TaxID=3110182 RepID=UPI002E775C8A|nr:heparan-alpha-glucosaminide N-acetyltransferase [Microvirga sp. CF3062]MEE1657713.1 heparan-alpha-glucosaminide N-acetyltransferase [Microvirga sp. CF3062]